jgi:hypothetical protein
MVTFSTSILNRKFKLQYVMNRMKYGINYYVTFVYLLMGYS